jgi:hypothetical protein
VRSYGSFVLRCWDLDGEHPRIKVEHVQSGASALVTSLAAAMAWITARRAGADRPPVETAGEQPAAGSKATDPDPA